ncbi:hypothetical protein SLEP1_g53757 [Rubroshorea leprosula]|uniref:Endoplasmic reticulum transmembrane protein n=1 Tax=Rubroshorea leprosula TaxID=152421 RepID=A0AAV5MA93_9ROSI|nr:hypothetical protein SLEP1_g53757 [Rubroshorea leprosula]
MTYDRQQAISAQIRSEEPRSKATTTAKTAETNDGDNEPAPAVGVGARGSAARAKPRHAGFEGTQAWVPRTQHAWCLDPCLGSPRLTGVQHATKIKAQKKITGKKEIFATGKSEGRRKMALQWMILTYVVAAEAALALLVTLPSPKLVKKRLVSLVSLILQPALFVVPFAGFQLLDIYWKNEHRLVCTSEICSAAERDRYEKSSLNGGSQNLNFFEQSSLLMGTA